MARLEVKSSGSPVLTLQPNEFLRVLKAYPIAETFPFSLR